MTFILLSRMKGSGAPTAVACREDPGITLGELCPTVGLTS
jgi:hypothetical protein